MILQLFPQTTGLTGLTVLRNPHKVGFLLIFMFFSLKKKLTKNVNKFRNKIKNAFHFYIRETSEVVFGIKNVLKKNSKCFTNVFVVHNFVPE